jgi:DNA helicase-2/ATP-dependent DNA helicase PcrA
MIKLSLAQEAIVKAPIGRPIQVLASAGSGKTRVLTERVRYIIENTKKEGLIALTFTNKAAEEMLSRLEDLEDIEERCWIATIHSVAQRVLDQYGHAIGLPSELHIYERDQDRITVFLQSLRNNGVDVDEFLNVSDDRARRDRERVINRYMEQISIVKRELLNEEEIKSKYDNDDDFWPIYQAYQNALLDSGGIDFDDILVYAHKIILDQPWCADIYRAKYRHICVDEAQDLNRAQYEFVKALCGENINSLLMVGDPNQMIYGFNGSSHDYLCNQFLKDFEPDCYDLKENYRSSKTVIHFANKIKPNSQIESEYALEGFGHIQDFQDEDEEASWICDKVEELIQLKSHEEIEGDIALDKIVVIGRNKFVFRALETCLENRNIPYFLKKGERHAEPSSVFGKVLDLGIRLRLNQKDWVDGKKLCAILKVEPPGSWGDDNLFEKMSSAANTSDIPYPDLQSKLLSTIASIDLSKPNIPKLHKDFTEIITELTLSKNVDANGELERSLRELNEFRDFWTAFKSKGLGESLSSFRNALSLGQLTKDYNPTGLTLSTVHTMKGLEKDIVFLMGMCEGIFPDYRAKTKKEIDEERNNAFVAVTRSRRWLYITYPHSRIMPWGDSKRQYPSRFITDMSS